MFEFRGIKASYDTLEKQAVKSVKYYFDEMVEMLDKKFGKDYAKNNPDLLAELVKACVNDFKTCSSGKIFFEGMEEIKDGLIEGMGQIRYGLDDFFSLMSKGEK